VGNLDANLAGYFDFSLMTTNVGNLNRNLGGYFELCSIMAG